MIIKPIHDNILLKIEEHEIEERTESGLIISNAGKSEQVLRKSEGTIIAVGEGRVFNNGEIKKPSVKEGQRVIFNKYAGSEIIIEDEKYLILKENDIVAIIEK